MIKAEKVFDEVFSARNFNTSPLTISNLDGDFYDYEPVIFLGTSSGNTEFEIRCNADSSANYRSYYMRGSSTNAVASTNDADNEMDLNQMARSSGPSLGMILVTGSSGEERYCDGLISGGQNRILKTSSYWKNTADNLTSLTFQFAGSATADAHIMLYRTPKASGQSSWELMETYSATAVNFNSSPTLIFSGLLGDTALKYKMDIEYTSAANTTMGIRVNSDSGSNYTRQNLRNKNGALASSNATSTSSRFSEENTAVTGVRNVTIEVDTETGVERMIKTSFACSTNNGVDQQESTCWYSNTATEVTGFTLVSDTSNVADVTAKLYRKRNPAGTGDTLPFEVIHSKELSATDYSAGETINILGDSMNLLKIEGLLSNASGDIEIRMQLNSDTASNYPEQLLKGDTSTASAASSTRAYIVLAKLQNGDQSEFTTYLYPKSGENRPALTRCSYDENAVEFLGQWWSNSADEITTAKIYASTSNGITGNIKVSRLV